MLLDEYEYLSRLNKNSVVKDVFPKVYSFHLSDEVGICYYTMERLEGVCFICLFYFITAKKKVV
jgi:hypothetical protein